MKIIFFGSGSFAVKSLKALFIAGCDIRLVVTQPDTRQGRHMHLKGTPVKSYALSQNLSVFQPHDINDDNSRKVIEAQSADIFIVVSYGRILSRAVLDLAKKMPINIHASLLPRYRGASPINQALINGDSKTGITFIQMNERMDEGDIIFKKELFIEKADNALILEEKLSKIAASSLSEVLSLVAEGKIKLIKQDSASATYAPLLTKEDGLICWNKKAVNIVNCFRGCFGWPGTYTYFQGSILKVMLMEEGNHGVLNAKPGEVIGILSDRIEVACLEGSVFIKEVLLQAHKKMSVKSFLSGHKVEAGQMLG